MRRFRAVFALLTLVFVLTSAPVLLLLWGRLAVPRLWTDDGSLLLVALTVAGWIAWAAFVLAVSAETVRFLSGNRFTVNLPLLGGLQSLTASLVLAAVTVAPSGSAGGSPNVAPVVLSTAIPDPSAPRPLAIGSGPAATSAERGSTASMSLARPEQEYVVAPGDDLWSLADRLLGEGTKWRELAAANPEVLTDPTRPLIPGTRLSLGRPAEDTPHAQTLKARTESPSTPRPAPTAEIVVERGDTLSGLAQEYLGKASRWPQIARENEGLVTDPDHIEVGWRLSLPSREPPTVSHPATGKEQSVSEAPVDEASPSPAAAVSSNEESPPPASSDGPPGPKQTEDGAANVTPEAQVRVSPPASARAGERTGDDRTGDDRTDASLAEDSPDTTLLGSVGVLAAAGLVGGWEARRLLQSRARSPGRRVLHPSEEVGRFAAALGRRQRPDRYRVLTDALRALSRHHAGTGTLLPDLQQVLVTEDALRFEWTAPAGLPPPGFGGEPECWVVDLHDPGPACDDSSPCAYPALVSLGVTTAGETVMVDLERVRVLGVAAATVELRLASVASMEVELGCAPWASEVSLTAVGQDAAFAAVAGGDAVRRLDLVEEGLALLRRRHAIRSRALAGQDLRWLRVDPERVEAVAPEVFVFHDELDQSLQAEVDALLAGPPVGIGVVLAVGDDAAADWRLSGDPRCPSGRFGGAELAAYAVSSDTRAAVEKLFQLSESKQTEPARWWAEGETNVRQLPSRIDGSEVPVQIVSVRPDGSGPHRVQAFADPVASSGGEEPVAHPVLLLIGAVDLLGAAGPEPTRARAQLIEMCSWVLEHPGRTSTQMAAGLGIAESTRRSNMSRLRSWLGAAPDGESYLPDAYSGRIRLHPEVSSDVEQLRRLTGPGVNRLPENVLVDVLELVRGALLADAAPGQWFWAEELCSDLSAIVRDAGLVLVERALARRDIDLARWAAERALVVAPEDELLICARIRTEHASGNRAAVQRLVARLARQARLLGVDLMPETILLCQQVVEGRLRRAL